MSTNEGVIEDYKNEIKKLEGLIEAFLGSGAIRAASEGVSADQVILNETANPNEGINHRVAQEITRS